MFVLRSCFLALVLLLADRAATAAMPAEQLAFFQNDLEYLATELPKRHANLFHSTPRSEFDAAVVQLRDALPGMSRGQAIVGLAGIVGLARDGHSALFLLPFPGAKPIPGIGQLPVQFYAFEDGLRIVAIGSRQRGMLGARVTAIGDVPIEQAIARVVPLLPRDNLMGEKEYSAWYLALPEVLDALALTTRAGEYRFTVESKEGRRELQLAPMDSAPDARWMDRLISLPGPRDAWVAADQKQGQAPPPWLARSDEPWWFETLDSGDVYAQINLLRETPQAKFTEFVERVVAAVPQEGKSRLVLDLRLNRGGDGELRCPLIYALIRHAAVNQPGRLFVLTGRRTFSAAQMLANALEQHTAALFVGEPTGSSPNHYGELGQLVLPQTGLTVVYSMLYWQHSPLDRRPWVPPHVAVQTSYADLASGADPVLSAALTHTPPPSVESVMGRALAAGDLPGAIAAFQSFEQQHRNPWRNLFEQQLNDLGYGLLDQQRAADSVAILKLSAQLYPDSWNAWDSLGEAQLAAGLRHRAAYSYARSLRLNPQNTQGAAVLQGLLETR